MTEKEKDKNKENKGFPLDALLAEADEEIKPVDEWEKKQMERRKKKAKILAEAIFAGDTSSAKEIENTINKFFRLSDNLSGGF